MTRFLKLMAAALLAALHPLAQAQVEPIKVGMVLTLSGPYAHMGEAIDRGARLYVKQLGDQTRARVEIVRRDDTGPNPDVARRLAQELIVRDKVRFLAGVVFTPNANAIAPLATQSKTPLVLMNATTSSTTRQSPYIVRVSLTQWQFAHPLGAWAAKNGLKRVYTSVADYAAGADSEAAFSRGFKDAGGELVGTVRIPQTVTDFSPYWQRVREAKPDAAFLFTNSRVAQVKSFSELGLGRSGIRLLGPGDLMSDEEVPAMGDAALGVITATNYRADSTLPQNVEFVKAWKKEYGADSVPSFLAVAGWDGIKAIYDTIAALGPNFTPEQALDYLRNWKNPNSPRGPIAIDPKTRDIVQNIYIGRMEKVGGRIVNTQMDIIPAVKDPWKEINPE